ncbi:MAG: hypothetical protein R3F62_02755 [Planctomycetota bacterium]
MSEDGASWDGPAFLFALDAPEAGQIGVAPAGEDPAPWDDPRPRRVHVSAAKPTRSSSQNTTSIA